MRTPARTSHARSGATRCPFHLLLPVLFASVATPAAPPPLETVGPESVGLSTAGLARVDDVIARAIARKEIPGAVVLVGRHGKVAFRKAYGIAHSRPRPNR